MKKLLFLFVFVLIVLCSCNDKKSSDLKKYATIEGVISAARSTLSTDKYAIYSSTLDGVIVEREKVFMPSSITVDNLVTGGKVIHLLDLEIELLPSQTSILAGKILIEYENEQVKFISYQNGNVFIVTYRRV